MEYNPENISIHENPRIDDYYEISINDIFRNLFKRKRLIIFSTFIGIASSTIFISITPKTYEGEFQIVLERDSKVNSPGLELTQLVNLGNFRSQDLKTTTKILESPSVLRPIFEYVKAKKIENNSENIPSKYNSWSPNVKINLIKGTSVLNVKYRDTEKELIPKVLNKISESYQEFSFRDKKNNQKNLIEWLDKQYSEMLVKSNLSLEKLQEFSLKYGLGNPDGLPIPASSSINNISQMEDENTNLSGSIPTNNQYKDTNMRFMGQFEELYKLEQELLNKSIFLKDNSSIIINLKKRIKTLKDSISRPKEVLLEYRKLQRNARRDEEVLSGLETSILSYKLEAAKKSDPWELISKPTISDQPVKPIPRKINLFGSLIGFLLGSLLAFIIETQKGILYNLSDYKKLLKYKYLFSLPILDIDELKKNFKIFLNNDSNEIINKDLTDVFLIFEDKFEEDVNSIKSVFINENINIIKDLEDIDKSRNLLLCVISGKISRKKMTNIINLLEISKIGVEGWMFIG